MHEATLVDQSMIYFEDQIGIWFKQIVYTDFLA